MSKSFEPMLAAKAKPAKGETDFAVIFNKFVDQFRYPMMVSAKLDGIRMAVKGGETKTRSLKAIPNRAIHQMFSRPDFEGLEGELLIGPPHAEDVYNRTQSAVMSHEGDISELTFGLFDSSRSPNESFEARFWEASQRLKVLEANTPHLVDAVSRMKIVPHQIVYSKEELLSFEAECLELGYEGIMGRDPKGTYKYGRSTIKEQGLVALKRFVDDEWVIVDFVPLYKNENEAETNELGRTKRSSAAAGKVAQDTLGAFVVETKDGIRFNVGGGTLLTAANRKTLWDIRDQLAGKFLKGRYFAIGTKDAPRQPRAVGLRDVLDM